MFVKFETEDTYEEFTDAEDVRQVGDLVIVTRTVSGKTVEIMVPAGRILRIETEHDEDIVAKQKAEMEAQRAEMEELKEFMRRADESSLIHPNNLYLPQVV